MAEDDPDIDPSESSGEGSGGFLARWSRRKRAARARPDAGDARPPRAESAVAAGETAAGEAAAEPEPPSLEALDEHSDYSAFLSSSKVTEELKHLALRKLFRGAKFNVCDGLDDYAEDYRAFTALTDALGAEVRRRVARGRDGVKAAAADEPAAPREARPADEAPRSVEPPARTPVESAAPGPDAGHGDEEGAPVPDEDTRTAPGSGDSHREHHD